MVEAKHNDITVKYSNGDRHGFDSINIDVKNTSSGALYYLQTLLEKEHKIASKQDCGIAWWAYVDLIKKMANEIDKKIKYRKNAK